MQHTFLDSFDIVIAYSRRDAKLMPKLRADLAAAGYVAWTGDYLRPESDYWVSSVEQALNACGQLVVILSTRSILARGVREAIRYALLNDMPIYPIVLDGEPQAVVPPNLMGRTVYDGRDALAANASLALPSMIAAIEADANRKPPTFVPRNPMYQWRLLTWLLKTPQQIAELQKQIGIGPLKRTASWLSVTLVFLLFVLDSVLEWLRNPQGMMILTVLLLLGLGVQTAVRESAGRRWASYRWSAIGAVGTMSVVLPLVLWLDPTNLVHLGHAAWADWLFLGMSVLVGGLALGITETFQVRSMLVPVVTMLNMVAAAASTIATLAASLATSINNEFGTIMALTGIAATVGALAIAVQYGCSFFIANDFVRAIYTRTQPSQLGKIIATLLPTPYVVVIVISLLSMF